VLKWLRANGAPWDERTLEKAVESGWLDVVKWLRVNLAPQ